MARKRTLSTLDTSIAYEAVGLDLAKEDTAIAAFGSDHEGPYLIDRMPYDKLYELLADMAPTLVAMEPCSGAHQIAEQIQELGHEVNQRAACPGVGQGSLQQPEDRPQ